MREGGTVTRVPFLSCTAKSVSDERKERREQPATHLAVLERTSV
jgi:hypothetical protein